MKALSSLTPTPTPGPQTVPDFRAALSEAAQSGNLVALQGLLEQSRELADMPDLEGYTPLHYAAYFGHAEMARYLLGIGADVAAVSLDPLRNQPLHAAASSGHVELAVILLDGGADPNAEQTGQWTPLHAAAAKGHGPMVELLLARGSDRKRESVSGATARAVAEERGQSAVVGLLG